MMKRIKRRRRRKKMMIMMEMMKRRRRWEARKRRKISWGIDSGRGLQELFFFTFHLRRKGKEEEEQGRLR